MERFAEDATLLQSLREYVQEHGVVESKVVEGKQEEGEKFADYFDYSEPLAAVPSHRALALLRGRRVLSRFVRCSMRGHDPILVSYAKGVEPFFGFAHDFEIGVTAHQDTDSRLSVGHV